MEKQFDIVAVGEILVDFVSRETADGKKLVLEGNPGGAPANVLAAASRLGKRTGLIGKVGSDGFGPFLTREIAAAGVDVRGVVSDPVNPTTLAMVTLDVTGKKNGRGAYLCFSRDCLAKAMKNRGLERSLKIAVGQDVFESLERELDAIESKS